MKGFRDSNCLQTDSTTFESSTYGPLAGLCGRLFAATALGSSLLLAAASAGANPTGGTVVGGQASIHHAPGVTTIDQASQKAIINWMKFSIAPSELTRFRQPGKEAIALNRVVGNDPSKVMGALKANGQVWLVNPNGVVFGPNARVDVHGILATTSDIDDRDFMAGRYNFDTPSPNPRAAVVNQGTISIGEKGLGALVAPHVRNDGVIAGKLGQVVLAGAETFTVDFYGDGLVQFAATSEVKEALEEQGAIVSNDGTIDADGGTVLITAAAAAEVVDDVINVSGVVEAQTVAMRDGVIVLDGGDEGVVHVAGMLDASGRDPGERGGTVKVLGEKVGLFDGARIDVSGDAGGGEALVGGNFQGKGPEPNAKRTSVAKKARIEADAVTEGDGGRIIVWADEAADIHGHLAATGGAVSGDGGFIETSAKQSLTITSAPDASAANGTGGTWLIDPTDISIVPGAGGAIGTSTVGVDLINRGLNSGIDVVIDTRNASGGEPTEPGTITQSSGAAISKTGGGDATLSLLAEGSIILNDAITSSSGRLNLIFGAGLGDGTGDVDVNANIVTNGGFLSVTGDGSFNSVGATLDADGGSITGGAVQIDMSGDVFTGSVFARSADSASGSISISSEAAIDTSAGELNTVAVFSDAGPITLEAVGDITTGDVFASAINLSGGESNDTGNSGRITILSTAGSVQTGGLLSPVESSFGSAGSSSGIRVEAPSGSITIEGLVWAFSNAFGDEGISGDGGPVELLALNNITVRLPPEGGSTRSIQSKSQSESGQAGNGATIDLVSQEGSIFVEGHVVSFAEGVAAAGDGGAITVTAFSDIDTGGVDARSNLDGVDGAISFSAGADLAVDGTRTDSPISLALTNATFAGGSLFLQGDPDVVVEGAVIVGNGVFLGAGRNISLLGGVSVESGFSVVLDAASGAIDSEGNATLTVGTGLTASAETGIGATQPLRVFADLAVEQGSVDIQAETSSGDIAIAVVGAAGGTAPARIRRLGDGDQSVGINAPGGSVDIDQQVGPLLVDADVLARENITLGASEDLEVGFVDVSASGRVALEAAGTVSMGSGSQVGDADGLTREVDILGDDFDLFLASIDGDQVNLRTPNPLAFVDPDTSSPGDRAELDSDELAGIEANSALFEGAGITFEAETNLGQFESVTLRSRSDTPSDSLDITQSDNAPIIAQRLGIEVGVSDNPTAVVLINGANLLFVFDNDFVGPGELAFGSAPEDEGNDVAASLRFTNAFDLSIDTVNPVGITAVDVDIRAVGALTVDEAINASGQVILEAQQTLGDNGDARAGNVIVNAAITAGSDIDIEADDFFSNQGAGAIRSNGGTVDIAAGGSFLQLLDDRSGEIAVGAAISSGGPVGFFEDDGFTVEFESFSAFTSTAPITADVGTIAIIAADFDIGATITSGSGDLALVTPGPLAFGSGQGNEASISTTGPDAELAFLQTDNLNVQAESVAFRSNADFSAVGIGQLLLFTGSVSQGGSDGPVTIDRLGIVGLGDTGGEDGPTFQIGSVEMAAPNRVQTLAIGFFDGDEGAPQFTAVRFDNAQDLTVGALSHFGGLFSQAGIQAEQVDLRLDGALTVQAPIEIDVPEIDDPTSIVIVAEGFDNFLGEGQALDPGPGRFLVYLTSLPSEDERGDLDNISNIISGTFDENPPSSITPLDENFFVYDIPQGTVTFTAVEQDQAFGEPDPFAEVNLGTDYRITFSSGLPENIVTGTPTLQALDDGTPVVFDDPDAANLADVPGSPYDIDIEQGSVLVSEDAIVELIFTDLPDGLEITPAPLQAVVQDASREYGDANPSFVAEYSGFKLGQSEAVLGEQSFATAAVPASDVGSGPNPNGTFPIQLVGFDNPNYTVDPDLDDAAQNVPGELRLTPAPLTGSAVARREYGESNDTADLETSSFSGFKLGQGPEDLGNIFFGTDATPASPVSGNPYDLVLTFENGNYVPGPGDDGESGIPGDFFVTRAPLTIEAADASRPFGEPNPLFAAIFEGFKLDDDPSVVTGLQFDTPAEPSSVPGTYPIEPFGATAANYTITFVDGTLTIEADAEPELPNSALPANAIWNSTFNLQAPFPLELDFPELNVSFGIPQTTAAGPEEDLLYSSGGNESFWGPPVPTAP